jgi:SlyX protein
MLDRSSGGCMSEDRLAELEMRTAFQDDTIAALNDVIVQQQQAITRLQRELKELREHVLLHMPQDRRQPVDERPPHY